MILLVLNNLAQINLSIHAAIIDVYLIQDNSGHFKIHVTCIWLGILGPVVVNDKLINRCSYGIFKYIDIFAAKMWKSYSHFFSKKISLYLPFQDRNFNITLANNFNFWTTGPSCV